MSEVTVDFGRPDHFDTHSEASSYYPETRRYYEDSDAGSTHGRSLARSLSQPSLARSASEFTERLTANQSHSNYHIKIETVIPGGWHLHGTIPPASLHLLKVHPNRKEAVACNSSIFLKVVPNNNLLGKQESQGRLRGHLGLLPKKSVGNLEAKLRPVLCHPEAGSPTTKANLVISS